MSNGKPSKINKLLFGTQEPLKIIPGILFAIMIMVVALLAAGQLNKILPYENNVVSDIFIAVVLGLLVRNIVPLPTALTPGFTFGVKKLLRLGIILMGIRLSILELLKIGAISLGLIVVCIAAALIITSLVAKRIGVSEKLGTLVAAGTSICGVSAIMATSPVIEADEEETAYAVATITVFGMLATMCYPYLTEWAFHLDAQQAGFFLGTSVHDTAQATASAIIYDELWQEKASAFKIAVTTKLVRNIFMLAVIPFLGMWYARKNAKQMTGKRPTLSSVVPFFVLGFVIMAVVRSLGDWGFSGDNANWPEIVAFVKKSAHYLIAVAVACIGLSTNVKKLAKLGVKPFICGLIAAVSVGGVSLFLVTLFKEYLHHAV
ncbi:MAG: putative sulfate exporter family transporter [Sedimentisphaerales bacterium]|nr:putative sulfate exporter family transporter [Sedimentisphaerales bacterium]